LENGHCDTNFAASDGIFHIEINRKLYDLPLVKVSFLFLGADYDLLFT